MFEEIDEHGKYTTCLTCGYVDEEIKIDSSPLDIAKIEHEAEGRGRRSEPVHRKLNL